METPRNSQKLSQIAVVAVHGVSDQKPFDSAQAIANMLLSLNNTQYTAFAERFLRILVRPLNKTPQNLSDIDLQFINEQIEDYKPTSINDNIYNSIRLEGKCISEDNQTEQTLHIYEMYWADLSRLGTGFVRIFGELYQIFFHLISLGNLVIDWACNFYCQIDSNNQKFDKFLQYWRRSQLWTGNLLALVIPILNLYLLIAACLSLPINIPEAYLPFIFKISLVIILSLITGWFLLKSNIQNFLTWLLLPLIVIVLVIFLLKIFNLFSLDYYRLITLEWLALLSVACWFLIIIPYNRHCPGVIKVAALIGFPLGVITVILLLTMGTSPEKLTQISLNLVEILYSLLFLTWLSFNILYFVTLVLSYIAIKKLKLSSAISAIKKTAWTARLSLAVPAILFLFLTLTLWQALANISESLLLETEFYQPLILSLFLPDFKDKIFTAPQFLQKLTAFSASPVAGLVVIVFAVAVIIAIWSLFPAIWLDIQPPNTAKDKDSSKSEALGNWLTNGFIAMSGAVSILLCLLIPLLFLAGFFLYIITSETAEGTQTILDIAAGVLTASATSIVAFGDRLNKITLGLRGVLDVALDVDNYLRLYPKEDNPRARIFARYTSLLRYLCQWRDPQNNQPYDKIIIISHSQGTVITADLLRWLQAVPDKELKRLESELPIYLFTMGSPLRQLYSFAFPHLYHWVSPINETSPSAPNPDQLLGVRQWVNGFRSGDYIGRYLWRSPKDQNLWKRNYISPEADPLRQEFCLGAGGHTHYWNENAPEIAQELERLIKTSVASSK